MTRIERRGEPLAVMVHDDALLEDPQLVDAVASAVRLTVDNQRLQSEIEAQLGEVEASRARIVAAGDAERRRIERDLHDGAQQRLVAIALTLRLAESRLGEGSDPATMQVLSQAVTDLGAAIDELRDLARGIHPAILSDSGLRVALESLIDRSHLRVQLHTDLDIDPPSDVAIAAYFTVSEALTNVAKYAGDCGVTVKVSAIPGRLRIEIADDGIGGANVGSGTGLTGMADRIAALGGRCRVDSPAGRGTRIEVDLPCALS